MNCVGETKLDGVAVVVVCEFACGASGACVAACACNISSASKFGYGMVEDRRVSLAIQQKADACLSQLWQPLLLLC